MYFCTVFLIFLLSRPGDAADMLLGDLVCDEEQVFSWGVMINDQGQYIPAYSCHKISRNFSSDRYDGYVVMGKKQIGPYNSVGPIKISSDGKSLTYSVDIDGLSYVIIDGEKMGPYEWMTEIEYFSDGKTLAYAANADQGAYIIVGNEQFEALFQELGGITFSSDGKVLAYGIISESMAFNRVLIDGQEYYGELCHDHAVYGKNKKIYLRKGKEGF